MKRILLLSLMVVVITTLCGFRNIKPEPKVVQAMVVTVLQTQRTTYIEVQRDDGIWEWLDMDTCEIKAGQRVEYLESKSHLFNTENWETGRTFNRLSYAKHFRIIPPEKNEHVYHATDKNGTEVFSDDPSVLKKHTK
jgi:hypothetical protein